MLNTKLRSQFSWAGRGWQDPTLLSGYTSSTKQIPNVFPAFIHMPQKAQPRLGQERRKKQATEGVASVVGVVYALSGKLHFALLHPIIFLRTRTSHRRHFSDQGGHG